MNTTGNGNTTQVCQAKCRLINTGPTGRPTFSLASAVYSDIYFSKISGFSGGLKCNVSGEDCTLDYKVIYGETDSPFGYTFSSDYYQQQGRETAAAAAAAAVKPSAVKGKSGQSNAVPCTKKGNKYNCQVGISGPSCLLLNRNVQ